jgi:hypothetical protein
VQQLVLTDPTTADVFARPVGTDGAADAPAPPPTAQETTTTTAKAVTTTAAPTTTNPKTSTTRAEADIPLPNADATKEGTVQASSTFSAEFPASLAIDGDQTTSWFSKGPGADGTSVYTWTGKRDDMITHVAIVGNGQNKKPEFQKNFGFGSVTVEVLDTAGDVDFTETAELPGTPDPSIGASA